jgi:hypothetical protein
MSKYGISDSDVEVPAAAIFGDEVNEKFKKDVQAGKNLRENVDALWKEMPSKNSALPHIHLAKIIVNGMNKAGVQFYPSLEKSKLPKTKIKYYVNLLLKEDKQEDYKKALDKKQTMVIDEDDLDSRVMNLTEESIVNMKKCSVYKIRNMKSLNDNQFASVIAGNDESYDKADKKKQTKEELEKSKDEFSKEHNIEVEELNGQLKEVRENPIKYLEQNLEIKALKGELERVERLCVDLMKNQLEEPTLVNIDDQTDPKPLYYLSDKKMVKVGKNLKVVE